MEEPPVKLPMQHIQGSLYFHKEERWVLWNVNFLADEPRGTCVSWQDKNACFSQPHLFLRRWSTRAQSDNLVSPGPGIQRTVGSQTMVVVLMVTKRMIVGFSGTALLSCCLILDDFSSRRASRFCRKNQRVWISLGGIYLVYTCLS